MLATFVTYLFNTFLTSDAATATPFSAISITTIVWIISARASQNRSLCLTDSTYWPLNSLFTKSTASVSLPSAPVLDTCDAIQGWSLQRVRVRKSTASCPPVQSTSSTLSAVSCVLSTHCDHTMYATRPPRPSMLLDSMPEASAKVAMIYAVSPSSAA